MIFLLNLFVISFVVTNSAQQIIVSKFSCQFEQQNYRFFKNIHTCYVREDLNVHQENIVVEIGSLQTYVKIPAFSIVNKSLFYLPRGIEVAFPNLEILEVIQSGLKKISPGNLEPFRELKYLDLCGNNIENLKGNLFQFNLKLEVLILNDNEIITVDQMTFYGLNYLKFLGFQRNRCFSNMTEDDSAVYKMIEAIKLSCSEEINRHSMNLWELKNEIGINAIEISDLKVNIAAVMDVNKNTSTAFDAHNKAVEGLRKQLFKRQKNLENTINKKIANLGKEKSIDFMSISTTNTELRRLNSLINICKQNIQEVATNVTVLKNQFSADLQSFNLTFYSKIQPTWSTSNSDSSTKSITHEYDQNSNSLHSAFNDKLYDLFINPGMFKSILDLRKWFNNTIDLVAFIDKIKKDIQAVQVDQELLRNNISNILSKIKEWDPNPIHINQNSSISANILNQNPANLLAYLLISNIILIILFCGIVIHLCCTQKSTHINKPLRIQAPTYGQLLESPSQTPLSTPLNINHESFNGQYEYISENLPTTLAFDDFYSETVQPLRNEGRNDGSESYAVVYRPSRE